MALPTSGKKVFKDRVVAIDLGSKSTKAALVKAQGVGKLILEGYTIQNTPILEGGMRPENVGLLTAHLKSILKELGHKPKRLGVVIGISESILRQVEMQIRDLSDMRKMLKFGSKQYLQQELKDFTFDVFVPGSTDDNSSGSESGRAAMGKGKALIGGAKDQLIQTLQNAAKGAGAGLDHIGIHLVESINAFEMAAPESFSNETVALVDIGFKNTTISILKQGEMALNRVLALGGDKFTGGLAEALSLGYEEAEAVKMGMPPEIQSMLESQLSNLGQELRVSIDFFEHQQDTPVTQVFVSGGSAKSDFIVNALQTELMIPCQKWNPLTVMDTSAGNFPDLELDAVQLGGAIGGAISLVNA